MSDFFKNPKANSVVVERVPCAFAKASNSALGTHYTVVIFDAKQNVVYVGSECEHKHGDSVQALHELGGKTCFNVTEKFRGALSRIKSQKGTIIDRFSRSGHLDDASPFLKSAFETAQEHMIKEHNARVDAARVSAGLYHAFPTKGMPLQRIVTKLTGHMLNLPKKIAKGKHSEKVKNHFKTVEVFPEVLKIRERQYSMTFQLGTNELKPGTYLVLEPGDEDRVFAIRDTKSGHWYVDEDRIKVFAHNNHTSIYDTHTRWKEIPDKLCIFCGENFDRMSKHTQGAKHKERVIEIVKLVCKATTPTGLRMINNPKHKSAFFRENVSR